MAVEWAGAAPPPLVTIGDIVVTPDLVITPQGTRPVGSVSWTCTDMSHIERRIPVWAIVCTVVFVLFCLLGLFFLLAREYHTVGWVQVGVAGQGMFHTTHLPVASAYDVARYTDMVNYARTVTASRAGG